METVKCHAIACTETRAPDHQMCYAHQRRFFIEQGNQEGRIKLAEQQGEEDGRNGRNLVAVKLVRSSSRLIQWLTS